MKNMDELYAKAVLAIIVIVSLFALVNKYSLKYTIIMMSSWIVFMLYNRHLSKLLEYRKIGRNEWIILWFIGWILTIIICHVTKGV